MSDKKTTTTSNQATNFNTNTANQSSQDALVNSNTTNGQLTASNGATSNTGYTQNTLPDWAQSLLKGNAAGIENLQGLGPTSLVAGPSALQTQAFNGAANLSSDPNGYFGAATGLIGKALSADTPTVAAGNATATDASGIISKFLNPNTDAVVNSTLADYDTDAARQQAAYAAKGAQNQAFGGSGYRIGEGVLGGELARGRATTDASVRNTAYTNAVQSALQQAGLNTNASVANANNQTQASVAQGQLANDAINRLLTGAGQLSNLGTTQNAITLANLGTQAQLGATQQGIDQALKQAPITLQGQLGSLLGSAQLGLLGGQQTGSSGSTSQTGSSLGQQIIDALTSTDTSSTGTSTGTSTTNGKSTETSSDPLGSIAKLISAGAAIAGAIPTGGASLTALPAVAGGSWYGG